MASVLIRIVFMARIAFSNNMSALFFYVQSATDPKKQYTVRRLNDGEWRCECPHFVFRKKECSHIMEGKRTVIEIVSQIKNSAHF